MEQSHFCGNFFKQKRADLVRTVLMQLENCSRAFLDPAIWPWHDHSFRNVSWAGPREADLGMKTRMEPKAKKLALERSQWA